MNIKKHLIINKKKNGYSFNNENTPVYLNIKNLKIQFLNIRLSICL